MTSIDTGVYRETKHTRETVAAAEKAGLKLINVELSQRDTSFTLHFQGEGDVRMSAYFDKRGYIRASGGRDPQGWNWVSSVSSKRHFEVTPAGALNTLVNFTLPRYKEHV